MEELGYVIAVQKFFPSLRAGKFPGRRARQCAWRNELNEAVDRELLADQPLQPMNTFGPLGGIQLPVLDDHHGQFSPVGRLNRERARIAYSDFWQFLGEML